MNHPTPEAIRRAAQRLDRLIRDALDFEPEEDFEDVVDHWCTVAPRTEGYGGYYDS